MEKDAPLFFGRENETGIISANLRTRRLTLLYGPTGVGKSSVLLAGVVHHLKELNNDPRLAVLAMSSTNRETDNFNLAGDPLSRLAVPSTCPIVVVTFANWLGDPLASLQASILRALEEAIPEIFTPELNRRLRTLGLREMLLEVAVFPQVVELLIILDQFEQYFVYHRTNEGPANFDDEFCRTVSSRDVHANFIISIREDWLARLDRFKGRIPNIFENAIRIDHLDRKSAEAAVLKPIEKYNAIIDEHKAEPGFDKQKVTIEEQFTPELLNQLEALTESTNVALNLSRGRRESRPKESRIQASGLQIVLRNLWDKIKTDTPPTFSYELVRDPETAKRIIQSNLERTLDQLTWKEKRLAVELFGLMITTSGAKLAVTVDELARQTGKSSESIEVLLEKLCGPKFRILSQVQPPPGGSDELRYELMSDALAGPIRDWIGAMRAKHRVRRNYIAFTLGLVVVFIIVALSWLLVVARKQQRIADEQRLALGEQKAEADRALAAVRALDDQVPYSRAVLRSHGSRVTSAVFTTNGRVLTASADGSAMLWDIESRKKLQEFRRGNSPLTCAAIDPQGVHVATASVDGRASLWSVGSTEPVQLHPLASNHVTAISFNKDGDLIAAATTAGEVIIWSINPVNVVTDIPGNGAAIRDMAFSPSGRFLAAAADDHVVRVWRVGAWNTPTILQGHTDRVNSVAFSPNENLIATAGADTTVRVWDVATGEAIRTLWGHVESINSVDFNDDGKRLLTASDDTTARVWTIERSKWTALIGHTDKVLSASFSPSGQQVVTGSADGIVRIWSTTKGTTMAEFRGHISQVNYVSYSSDGQYVLTAGEDATARVWFAPGPGNFRVDQPTITVATTNPYRGPCPVTIKFVAQITALSGSGNVVYKFIASDGRSWLRESGFDEPNVQTINWYWRVDKNYNGFETIEVVEPKGIKQQKATFSVRCTGNDISAPSPTPALSPSPNTTP